MVSKITVSILALIGWNLVEGTGDEGKLLKLRELWAIKRSVLARQAPLMREKKRCELSVVVSLGGGKGVKRPFGCYDGLSDVRKTSSGITMTKVSPDGPPLAPLWLQGA
ncbi:MAG: hypothetical protein ACFNWZ_01765 [Candidatus Absconditicoccaceae bacterium]